jgi:tetratricopeptide (TPR) repeat protein
VSRLWGCALVALLLGGCAATPRPQPRASPAASTVADLAAAIAADASRSDHESDSRTRGALAAEASQDAAACISLEPQAAACLYGRAIALGLEARAHPTRAGELLTAMLGSLGNAEAADPTYDEAGPARVRALVLIRAPGWPLGPGDAEAAVVAARRAAALRPQYPPNLLALAEALAKTGDSKGARANYERARELAQSLPATADRDSWVREADEALRRQ